MQRAAPAYDLPRPFHKGVQEYQENPFLVDRTCYSFSAPKEGRHQRWKEGDRDTGDGGCKANRDCRQGDGPRHTDPKMPMIRDRLDSHGALVLRPAPLRVPAHMQDRAYFEMDREKLHYHKARPPPFKGAGGARTPMWEVHVEANLGHGHGVFPHQQGEKGEYGRVPFSQSLTRYRLRELPVRKELVRRTFLCLGGKIDPGQEGEDVPFGSIGVEMLERGFQANRTKEVISRQKTPSEAQRDMLKQFEIHQGNVSYEEWFIVCDKMSSQITDDGFFGLQMCNQWGIA